MGALRYDKRMQLATQLWSISFRIASTKLKIEKLARKRLRIERELKP
jgi:hypothetical protein